MGKFIFPTRFCSFSDKKIVHDCKTIHSQSARNVPPEAGIKGFKYINATDLMTLISIAT